VSELVEAAAKASDTALAGRALQRLTEAVRRLASTDRQFELARAQLVYGEWLQRQRPRGDARRHLIAANAAFEAMGADGFASRAGRAIVATGQRPRQRVDNTRLDLTPRERQIAQLARADPSNPEIATRLSISPRTVEYQLGKVFSKLGIRTRGELRTDLGTGPGKGPGTP